MQPAATVFSLFNNGTRVKGEAGKEETELQ